ncbi:hypothetical protein [Nocardia terpenica]|uniref:Uncharacterized protein n=1 Tax=Nocardia terpenica TaxID=455432 RepID=A0A164LCT3_9NOCA|nr:hypothetical protein [Nocardia terpenica]KZM72266.1 hypothetical protein AWN90_36945 [Nocardia terpenica]NQE86588.1 hypothetical protein [Nocardia terpenica]
MFVPTSILESLDALLEYNWDDEQRDYAENGFEPGHLFEHMGRLAFWRKKMSSPDPTLELRVDEKLFAAAAARTEVPVDGDWAAGWTDALFSLIRATAEVEESPGGVMFSVTGLAERADVTYDTDYDECGEIRGIELFVESCNSETRLARVYYDSFDRINEPRYLPWRRDIATGEQLLLAVISDLNHALREVRNTFVR